MLGLGTNTMRNVAVKLHRLEDLALRVCATTSNTGIVVDGNTRRAGVVMELIECLSVT